ncbi:MAG: sodium:solute symporter [Planctomycetota bacterium]|nr:sodium:solute symporter [Planctomycetota bacterium]
MNLGLVDQFVLYVYLVGIVVFGCYFSRRNTSSARFMDAGGALPGWVVGLSLFGTYLSSISFLANPGKSFDSNWNPFVFSLSLPVAAWVATKWFVPFYRKTNSVSAYSHLEERFGKWAKNYVIICYLLTQTVRVGAILLLVAIAVQPISGFEMSHVIVSLGIAVILYTLLGGIEAVIWTDVVQSIVLTAGIIIALIWICVGMPGGALQIFEIAYTAEGGNKFSLGSFSASLGEPTFWVILVFGLLVNLQNFGIDQSYVQRYATAKDEQAAKRSVWLACGFYVPVSALLFFVGTGLYAFYEVHPELVPGEFSGDQSFAYFIATRMPTGLTGLLLAAILAAAMSSIDSSLNSCATLICRDVAPQFTGSRDQGFDQIERRARTVLLTSTVGIGAIGIGIGLWLIGTQSILDSWWKLSGIFSGGMLGLFLLGLTNQKTKSQHAVVGVCGGVTLIIWMTLSGLGMGFWGVFRYPFHANLIIVFGTVSVVVLGYAAAILIPEKQD